MEFAKRQLRKQGWTEGSGLGKNEDGRSEAIKVSLKMDKRGVGHDPGKEFTDHWWLRVFNEAAQKVGKKDQAAEDVSEEALKVKQKEEKKKSFYRGFVQAATLTNGVEEAVDKTDSSSEDEEINKVSVPTLEDIHKFCGGATGHKAARHGISMEGKLDRVTKYEKIYEEKLKKRISNNGVDSEEPSRSKKQKKRKRKEGDTEDASTAVEPEKSKKRKKSKHKDRESGGVVLNADENAETTIVSPSEINSNDEVIQTNSKSKRKRDKKKEKQDSCAVLETYNEDVNSETSSKKKKKKRKSNNDDASMEASPETKEKECDSESKKKKKKKKRKEIDV